MECYEILWNHLDRRELRDFRSTNKISIFRLSTCTTKILRHFERNVWKRKNFSKIQNFPQTKNFSEPEQNESVPLGIDQKSCVFQPANGCLLCILTSKWVLCMSFTGQNDLFLAFYHVFLLQKEKRSKSKKNKETTLKKGSTSLELPEESTPGVYWRAIFSSLKSIEETTISMLSTPSPPPTSNFCWLIFTPCLMFLKFNR